MNQHNINKVMANAVNEEFLIQVLILVISSLADSNYQVVLTNGHLIKTPDMAEVGRLIVGQPGNVIACINKQK